MNVDPTKMTLTEDEFVAICSQGLQKYMSIGAIITLNNSYQTEYEVIGVEHEGVLNSVDIMAHKQVYAMTWHTSNVNNYTNSAIRQWINTTYLGSFSYDIRELMKPMTVITAGETNYDKVKLLTWKEYNGVASTYCDDTDGGIPYEVFVSGGWQTAIPSRWRNKGIFGNDNYIWTASRSTYQTYVWTVNSGGLGYHLLPSNSGANTLGVLPVMRF